MWIVPDTGGFVDETRVDEVALRRIFEAERSVLFAPDHVLVGACPGSTVGDLVQVSAAAGSGGARVHWIEGPRCGEE